VNSADKAKEFDALWRGSIARAGRRPDWNDLSLIEQQAMSSTFRAEMDRYGDEDPTAANRTRTGLYASPTSSRHPG
jgi:hypothetical protein